MGGVIYFISILFLSISYYISTYIDLKIGYKPDIFQYANPLVVISASGLLMVTANIKLKPNKIIYFISSSAFAVYLFHLAPTGPEFYIDMCRQIYENYSNIQYLLLLSAYMIIIFLTAILLDKPRKFIWNVISNFFLLRKNIKS